MVETTSVQNPAELGPTPWDHFDLDKIGDVDVIKPGSRLDILHRQAGSLVDTPVTPSRDFSSIINKPADLNLEAAEKSVEDMSDEELRTSAQDFFDKGDFDSSIDTLRRITSKKMVNKIAGTLVLKLVEAKNFERADDYAQLISDKDFFDEVQSYIKDEEEKVIKANPFTEPKSGEGDLSAFETTPEISTAARPERASTEEDPLEAFRDSAVAVPAEVVQVELTHTPSPEAEVGLDEKIEQNLESTRREYATHLIEWKNAIRIKKSKFRKVLADLGVDRQLPQEPEPEELVEARSAYIKAKKEKNKALIESMLHVPNQAQRPLGLFEAVASENRDKLSEEVEKEFGLLQELISKGISVDGKPAPLEKGVQLERGVILRGLDIWRNLNQMQRLAITSTVVFGAGMFGGLGILGAASFSGMRAVKSIGRSAAGVATSLGAGRVVDVVYDSKNERSKNTAFKKYLSEINFDNFDEKEKEIMKFLDEEKDEKKRQMLKKALVMGLAAGATNVGIGIADSIYGVKSPILTEQPKISPNVSDVSPNTPEINYLDKLPEAPTTPEVSIDNSTSPVLPNGLELKPESVGELESGSSAVEAVPTDVPEAKVNLSSKGFIQDIHKLKAEILAEYHDKPIPEAVQTKILSVPSAKLAEQLGLYDGAHNASGVGLKGEQLIFKDGGIFYGGINGEEKSLFNPLTGEVHKFAGEFVSAEVPDVPEKVVDLSSSGVATTDTVSGNSSGTEELLGDPITTADEIKLTDPSLGVSEVPVEQPVVLTNEQNLNIETNIPKNDVVPDLKIPVDGGKSVDVMSLGGQRVVTFEGLPIGHEEGGLLALDDSFQDGPENAQVRGVFAKAFEGTVRDSLGPRPIAESFEGGKIYVSFGVPTDPEKVRILLNGKEIAVGTLKNGIPEVEIHSELKRPWYLSDSVYERAFKHINELVKTGSFNFKI